MFDQLPGWLQRTQLPAWMQEEDPPKKKKSRLPSLPSLGAVVPGLEGAGQQLQKTIDRTPGAILDVLKGIWKDPTSIVDTGTLTGAVAKAAVKPVAGRLKAALRFWVPGEKKPREFTGPAHPFARLDAEAELGDLLDDNFEPRFREESGFVDPSGNWFTREEALEHAKKNKLLGGNPKAVENVKRSGQLKAEALKQQGDSYADAVDIPTRTFAEHEPDEAVRELARAYNKGRGMADIDDFTPAKHPEPLFRQLSDWYEQAKNDPADPAVIAAYKAFNDETHAQYEALKKAGYKFEPTKDAVLDAYPDARAMREDVANKRLKVFTGGEPNALMTPEQNFEFRAVHDVMAHSGGGYEFHPDGEFNAALKHSQMYSPDAQRALFTETVGQNANLNYGPNGEFNRTNMGKEIFPEQKAAVVPQAFIDQMVAMRSPQKGAPKVIIPKGDVQTPVGKAAGMRDDPAAINARIQRALDIISRPVEPWSPVPRGLVDRSLIAPDDVTKAGKPTLPHERTVAKTDKKAMGHLEGLDSPANIDLVTKQIQRGRKLGGETFYPSFRAIDDAIAQHGGNPVEFRHATSAGSARNSILNEQSVGTVIRYALERGILDVDAIGAAQAKGPKAMIKLAERVRKLVGKDFPDAPGIPMMPTHLINFRKLELGLDPEGAFKIPTYDYQKGGGLFGSVLDTHEATGGTMGSPYHRYFSDQGGFGPEEYGPAEGLFGDIAGSQDLTSRAGQASRWMGGGELTGLKSAMGDAAQHFEDHIFWNARERGLEPKKLLEEIARRRNILYPWFKKGRLPIY